MLDIRAEVRFLEERYYTEAESPETYPLRMIIAGLIYDVVVKLRVCSLHQFPAFMPCQGCLNKPRDVPAVDTGAISLPCQIRNIAYGKTCFRDFDLYTLQRVPAAFDIFCAWKNQVQSQAEGYPILPNAELQVDWNGFQTNHQRWRSPYKLHDVPSSTLEIVTRRKGARDDFIDANRQNAKFSITEVKRSGRNKFSQVFVGHLVTDKGTTSQPICLKLFDERLFPIPERPDYTDGPPKGRLLDLNFADDMMRREEAAYNHRLRYLQGSMVPHCYGFHEVWRDVRF